MERQLEIRLRDQQNVQIYSPRSSGFTMRLFTAQLFILVSSLSTFAISIRSGSVPHSLASVCPSVEVVSSSTVNINGEEVVRQVFSCPDGNLTVPAIPGVDLAQSRHNSERSLIQARGAAECTTPAAECQCGQPCETAFKYHKCRNH